MRLLPSLTSQPVNKGIQLECAIIGNIMALYKWRCLQISPPLQPHNKSFFGAFFRNGTPEPQQQQRAGGKSTNRIPRHEGGSSVGRSKSYLRRRRRRRSKLYSSDNVFKGMHSNIRGYDSKVSSLNNILGRIKPSVLTINETLLKNQRKVSLPGFLCFSLNRDCMDGGGIVV